jgi:chromosome condensin MukBEF ATPase and DNA-binding subunit MukB
LSEDLKEERDRRVDVEKRLIEVEARGKSNTHRLNKLEKE